MEDLIIYAVVIFSLVYIISKTFGKKGGCGCGGDGSCSKK
ncbi:FeoB-associated Cys-rich membrane protein [Arcobacter arenosus]|jgi:hypothetical protein|uniref:FeoB-associated Cys-rich membrane protein n=1 Tax=Arcobacter arenosus TaxID=2576037 RepID=A0A5R8Y3M3_9BACT|nr:FeoB-associated Cys-rich membrane protein [Arcobacter arenosus]TLP40568.1 FeoB-associated Cys-rich membrane protein [Arcobacter arenosus]